MTDKDILLSAIELYGIPAQMDMCIEEMSELTKELCKNKRGRDNKDAIAEEIADVEIMLAQMKLAFAIASEVNKVRIGKIKRLMWRMTEGNK